MKKIALLPVILSGVFSIFSQAAGKSARILTVDNLTVRGVSFREQTYSGRDAINVDVIKSHTPARFGGCNNCTFAIVNNVEFSEGTIEIDLAGKPATDAPPWVKGFVGIVLHMDDQASQYQGFTYGPSTRFQQMNNSAITRSSTLHSRIIPGSDCGTSHPKLTNPTPT